MVLYLKKNQKQENKPKTQKKETYENNPPPPKKKINKYNETKTNKLNNFKNLNKKI